MQGTFQLVAGHMALDFTNTLDYRFDPDRVVDLLSTYDRFLDFALQSGVVTALQARKLARESGENAKRVVLKSAIELREVLDALFRSIAAGAAPSRSCLETFNRFLAKARDHESLVWKDSEFMRTFGDLSGEPDAPIWPLVDAAATLLTSAARTKIRECKEASCRWLFLDHSKNHSRRWCAMNICGNRTKVRRFRQRKT